MVIEGKITKVFCIKEGWASILVSTEKYGSIKAAGKIVEPRVDMLIEAKGEIDIHPVFGEQFKVSSAQLSVPKNKSDIIRYLKSDFIKGCGAVKAEAIVAKFGTDTLNVIENDWMRLTEVKGISKKTAQIIYESNRQAAVYKNLLANADLTARQVQKIYEQYKEKSLDVLENNPYDIIFDIVGFGFKTVDRIALKNGFSPTSPKRIAAVLNYVLTKIGDDGHCYCNIDTLEVLVKEQIPDIDSYLLAQVIQEEIRKGTIVIEDSKVYAIQLYTAETSVANGICELLKDKQDNFSQTIIDDAILDTELENGFELEKQQKQAVQLVLNHRISVITGGPGTGKSTLIKAIIKAWIEYKDEDSVYLCAPTGKAAHRMSEVTGLNAMTVHKFIYTLKSRLKCKENSKTEKKLVIVDESSMLDLYLANQLVEWSKNLNFAIVFIGDVDQLPPIGPGSFFRDLVDSIYVPTVKLNLCHRQKGLVAINSKKINEGSKFSLLSFGDTFKFVGAKKEDARDAVISEYLKLTQKYNLKDICCIVPMRKSGKSHTSADDLNKILREALNCARDTTAIPDTQLYIGDRVMNTANDTQLELVNGDCGSIIDYDSVADKIVVSLDDGRMVMVNRKTHNFIHSYAVTAHKSQGTEYKAVVIVHNKEHFIMLQRNLLYTAVTRAKEEVILVGEPSAYSMAINNTKEKERRSKLKSRIALNCVTKNK